MITMTNIENILDQVGLNDLPENYESKLKVSFTEAYICLQKKDNT